MLINFNNVDSLMMKLWERTPELSTETRSQEEEEMLKKKKKSLLRRQLRLLPKLRNIRPGIKGNVCVCVCVCVLN